MSEEEQDELVELGAEIFNDVMAQYPNVITPNHATRKAFLMAAAAMARAVAEDVDEEDEPEVYDYHFSAHGYSDGCVEMPGACCEGCEVGAYQGGSWFEFRMDGEVVGRCRMEYDRGWKFVIESNHDFKAGENLEDE